MMLVRNCACVCASCVAEVALRVCISHADWLDQVVECLILGINQLTANVHLNLVNVLRPVNCRHKASAILGRQIHIAQQIALALDADGRHGT